ncbi:hypothetical protein RFI_03035 [Reticulomyxa filosa]|uniref:Uncharacterized protein n=1 Tax=Reticulomyxa filosa TaxID=46433 RepID=X6P6B0_RETFI|nr:hypothetical protein RFI_03035 [Reticulomyxa filosa]|eukprot:ETO34060.1 hypothetical protein RFI_03035 [Reticulomyxa filosa]
MQSVKVFLPKLNVKIKQQQGTKKQKSNLVVCFFGRVLLLAREKGLHVPSKSKKTAVLRLLFSHLGIEDNNTIEKRETRLAKAYVRGFKNAVVKADRDTESILGMMLHDPSNPIKIRFDDEMDDDAAEMELVKKLCNYCQTHGKEIKDCKPDYYAHHYLFNQLTRLAKVKKSFRISKKYCFCFWFLNFFFFFLRQKKIIIIKKQH